MAKRVKGINEVKGKTISDLEAILVVFHKLLDDKLEEKPTAGITLAKDQKNEKKVRYSDVKVWLNELTDFFVVRGCFSIGVCDTCTNLNKAPHANKAFGTCKLTGKTCHIWDTCPQHSKKGGGYGV